MRGCETKSPKFASGGKKIGVNGGKVKFGNGKTSQDKEFRA